MALRDEIFGNGTTETAKVAYQFERDECNAIAKSLQELGVREGGHFESLQRAYEIHGHRMNVLHEAWMALEGIDDAIPFTVG
jgi:hypothetical protein